MFFPQRMGKERNSKKMNQLLVAFTYLIKLMTQGDETFNALNNNATLK